MFNLYSVTLFYAMDVNLYNGSSLFTVINSVFSMFINNLGSDSEFVFLGIMNSKKGEKLLNYSSWVHKSIKLSINEEYVSLDSIKEYLTSLDKNKNYVLIIAVISDKGMFMAPREKNSEYFIL